MATLIKTTAQRLMAEHIIEVGPLEAFRSLAELEIAGGSPPGTAARYKALLRKHDVVRAWVWAVDDAVFVPELPGGSAFWLPSGGWDDFMVEARTLGLFVRELRRDP